MANVPLTIEAPTEKDAIEEAAKQLAVPPTHLQAEKLEGDQFRITYFSAPGKLEFKISDDKMTAVIAEMLPPEGVGIPAHVEWVRAVQQLAQLNVVFGINENKFRESIFECVQNNRAIKGIEIARGLPPEKGIDSTLQLFFSLQPAPATADVNAALIKTIAMKGDVLLIKTKPRVGKPGTNIFREEVQGVIGKDISIQCGENVEMRDAAESVDYIATAYGRIAFQNNKLSVTSLVTLNSDQSRASIDLIHSSCRGSHLTYEQVFEGIQKAKITSGILTSELKEAIEKINREKTILKSFVVAQETPAQNGSDGFLEICHFNQWQPFKNPIEGLVAAKEILARIQPPTKAKNGTNVIGKNLSGKDGQRFKMNLSRAVETKNENGVDLISSPAAAYIKITNLAIETKPLVHLADDGMSATFDFYPAQLRGLPLTAAFVLKALEEAGVKFGIQMSAIEQSLQNCLTTKKEILKVKVAAGEIPVAGKDGWVEKRWKFTQGSDRGFVTKAETIAILHPAQKGKIGRDVRGNSVPTQDGVAQRLNIGSGIKQIDGESGQIKFETTEFGQLVEDRDGSVYVEWELVDSKEEMELHGPLSKLSAIGKKISLTDVTEALKAKNILSVHCVTEIQKFLAGPSAFEKSVFLARGILPQEGTEDQFEALFSFNGLSGKKLFSASPADLSTIVSLDLVHNGDALVKLIRGKPGINGKTIYGEAVPAKNREAKDLPFEFGSSVRFEESRSSYICAFDPLGYVDFRNKKIEIFPPLRVSDDRHSVSVSIYPSHESKGGKNNNLTDVDIVKIAEGLKIKVPIDLQKFEKLQLEVLDTGKPIENEIIIRGKEPSLGVNEQLSLKVGSHLNAGEMRDDQSMDFRVRQCILNVKANDELYSVTRASPGEDGQDIFGKPIPTVPAKLLDIVLGENVKKVETDGGYKIISETDGAMVLTANHCSVIKAYVVEGDVDLNTGNIKNENGSVIVRGSVHPLFEVFAGDELIVEGMVDDALLHSKTRAVVMKGVIGSRARIYGETGVEVGLANEAEILSKGKISVRTESYYAKISSDDEIKMESERDRVAGGYLKAFNKISVSEIGNAKLSVITHLEVGKNFVTEKEIEDQIKNEKMEAKIREIEEQLEYFSTKPDFSEIQKKLLEDEKNQLAEKIKTLRSKIKTNSKAIVEARGKVHVGTQISILSHQFSVKEPLQAVRFRLNEEGTIVEVESLVPSKEPPPSKEAVSSKTPATDSAKEKK